MYEILCYCHLIEKSYLLNKDNMKSKMNYPLDKHLFKVSNASRAMSMVVFLVSLPLILKRYLLTRSSPYFKWIPARPKASVSKIILKKIVLMKFGEVFGEHAWSRPYLIKLQTKYLCILLEKENSDACFPRNFENWHLFTNWQNMHRFL